MPHTRRRKFMAQNDISKRNPRKIQNGIQTCQSGRGPEIKPIAQNLVSIKSAKLKSKANSNSSKAVAPFKIIPEHESTQSTNEAKRPFTTAVDKNVTASSSSIDLLNIEIMDDGTVLDRLSKESIITQIDIRLNNDVVQSSRDRTAWRRDKHSREHRVKVRSPKRRVPIYINNERNIQTTGTVAIDWNLETCHDIEATIIDSGGADDQHRCNDDTVDDMCRICHGSDGLSPELGSLISACSCRGTVGRVHVKCLERWLTESGKSRCELCGTRYITKRVHKYGVPRALIMWVLSQNAKQLMVDSLGIMLMSPLAVLAAWLSGRTLAGLMTQDSHATPWPLASTFVLACMTLVCYYCWIVSAATRHAIGWWIWYRSQYEVRLQFEETEN